MTKVLLTGGSGFIASHILKLLLEKGHSVVTTVRSEEKAAPIRATYADVADRLQIVLVPDVAQPGAFDEAVRVPGIEVVLHTASPFHYRTTDLKRDLVDPAVEGTTGILRAIAAYAPQVRRVVVTSSFAAIINRPRANDPTAVFSESTWNPISLADVTGANNTPANAGLGYQASKTLAEHAAWDFVRDQKPNFDLVTVNPPMVYGPVLQDLGPRGLAALNTSVERVRDALNGSWKKLGHLPDTGVSLNYVDVRDVAQAHVLAGLERPAAGGHRLFVTPGLYDNRILAEILRRRFPEFADRLPPADAPGGAMADPHYSFDNSETNKILGIQWINYEQSIVDTVNSIKALL